jgi:hypothetical protein
MILGTGATGHVGHIWGDVVMRFILLLSADAYAQLCKEGLG